MSDRARYLSFLRREISFPGMSFSLIPHNRERERETKTPRKTRERVDLLMEAKVGRERAIQKTDKHAERQKQNFPPRSESLSDDREETRERYDPDGTIPRRYTDTRTYTSIYLSCSTCILSSSFPPSAYRSTCLPMELCVSPPGTPTQT